MDPNANLEEMLRWAEQFQTDLYDGNDLAHDDAQRFLDLFEALDEWLRKGGALPQAWERR